MFLISPVYNLSLALCGCQTDRRIWGRATNRSANTLDRILEVEKQLLIMQFVPERHSLFELNYHFT